MDDFLKFNFVRIDATDDNKIVASGEVTERVDLIARQFRDFLRAPRADDGIHGILVSNEFKLRRRVGDSSGWMSFFLDVGDGREEKLEEVAILAIFRELGESSDDARKRISEYVSVKSLPAAPVAVAVELKKDIPLVIREWYPKAAAGFLSKPR